MKKSILAAAVVGALVWASGAQAGPLLPNLATDATGAFIGGVACGPGGTRTCIAGEGAAPNAGTNTSEASSVAVLHTDWIVMHTGGTTLANSTYRYFFQVENTSVFALTLWQVGGFFTSVDTVLGAGLDLDTNAGAAAVGLGAANGHNGTNYTNLGSSAIAHDPVPGGGFNNPAVNETECTGVGCAALSGIVTPTICFLGSITCVFAAGSVIPVGKESSIIIAEGPRPVPVDWDASGTKLVGTTNWNSIFLNDNNIQQIQGESGVKIPSPFPARAVPEPGSILLLGSGLLGLGFWGRRRRVS